MSMQDIIRSELEQTKKVLEEFISDENNRIKIEETATLISGQLKKGGKVMTCGNGGSYCDAMHFAQELSGNYRELRKPIAAIALSDPAVMSCIGNDFGYDEVFSRSVAALGSEKDVLLCISTSGNSTNIINAAKSARELGMKVVSLTGKSGGSLAPISNLEIRVPHYGFADRIQEIHIKIIHILILLIEKNLEN